MKHKKKLIKIYNTINLREQDNKLLKAQKREK